MEFIQNKRIKSIVDYVIGIEVGIDTNGRKNRTGSLMESIVEFYIKKICDKKGYRYIEQATKKKIKAEFGIDLAVDKSSRTIDFGVLANNELFLIETNFYGGGGSKLKSTAGEYITMNKFWTDNGYKFIWVTDGIGWETTKKSLEESFNKLDYLLNLEMVAKGILEEILKNEN